MKWLPEETGTRPFLGPSSMGKGFVWQNADYTETLRNTTNAPDPVGRHDPDQQPTWRLVAQGLHGSRYVDFWTHVLCLKITVLPENNLCFLT